VKGLALMSAELDSVGVALVDGKVPAHWLKRSFPSLKPLGAYMTEVHDRIAFFQSWLHTGPPIKFWLSGFFFTQAFLTASKQNFARKMSIPIDHIDFDFVILDNEADTRERPPNGVLTFGSFLEGCTWNYETHGLCESEPKVRSKQPLVVDYQETQRRLRHKDVGQCSGGLLFSLSCLSYAHGVCTPRLSLAAPIDLKPCLWVGNLGLAFIERGASVFQPCAYDA
jgi:hypothetical protein